MTLWCIWKNEGAVLAVTVMEASCLSKAGKSLTALSEMSVTYSLLMPEHSFFLLSAYQCLTYCIYTYLSCLLSLSGL